MPAGTRFFPVPGFVVCVLSAFAATAQVPHLLGYQGRLLRADGTAATGTATVVFAVYDGASGGSALWQESQTLGLSDGYYSTYLGLVQPVGDSLFDAGARWLEVRVGSETLAPRQQIGAIPYAVAAQSVVGSANVASLRVGGQTVVDAAGRLSGPARYLAGPGIAIDVAQTVSLQNCGAGQTLVRDGTSWQCAAAGTLTGLTAAAPLAAGGSATAPQISLAQAAANASGFLSSSDWSLFAGKYDALTQCGGDLSGTLGTPVVARLQSRPVSAAAPATDQVLKWNGAAWAPAADLDTGITSVTAVAPLTAQAGARSAELSILPADSARDGYLSSADFARFDAKYGADTTCGGDLRGNWESPEVKAIRGFEVSASAPAGAQVLRFDGSRWAPASLGIADVGGLSSGYLDLSGTQTIGGAKSFTAAPAFGTPLPASSGGTGTATAPAANVFAGPVSGLDSAPAFRALAATDIPPLDASLLTAGTLDAARVPVLDASKIATGVLDPARIPATVSITGSAGSVPWGGVTDKPSTLAGYGISDAFPAGGTLAGLVRSTAAGSSYFTGGSLGIGTTSPVARAHVAHSASGSGEALRLENSYSTGSQSAIGFIGNGLSTPQTRILGGPQNSGGSGAFAVYNSDPTGASYQSLYATNDYNDAQGQRIVLSVGASERMRVDNQGRVGVGTTSPQSTLHVAGAGPGNPGSLKLQNTSTSGRTWQVGEVLTSGKFDVYDTAVGTRLTIDSGGNVGIGTTTPAERLSVAGNLALAGTLQGSRFQRLNFAGRNKTWQIFSFDPAWTGSGNSEALEITLHDSPNYDTYGAVQIIVLRDGSGYARRYGGSTTQNVRLKTYLNAGTVYGYLVADTYCDMYTLDVAYNRIDTPITQTDKGADTWVPPGTLVMDSSTAPWTEYGGPRSFTGGSVGIGTTSPSASAALEIQSTSQGLLLPRLTTAQRDAVSGPAAGLILFNSTTKQIEVFDGTVWTAATPPGPSKFTSYGLVSAATKSMTYVTYTGSAPTGPNATQYTRSTAGTSGRPGGYDYTDVVLKGDFTVCFYSSHGSDGYNMVGFNLATYTGYVHAGMGTCGNSTQFDNPLVWGFYTVSGNQIDVSWNGVGSCEGTTYLARAAVSTAYYCFKRASGAVTLYESTAAPGEAGVSAMTLKRSYAYNYTGDVRLGLFVHDTNDYLEVYSPGTSVSVVK